MRSPRQAPDWRNDNICAMTTRLPTLRRSRSPASAKTNNCCEQSVREFAEAQIRPLVREMDEHAKIPARR